MLADAIRSETYRFARNRMAMVWSILFVPTLFLAIATAVQLFTKARMAEMAANLPPELTAEGGPLATSGPLDLGRSLVSQAADFSNPIVMLFILIGAAIVYAGDYRWETWRLTSARNSRANLILGKLVLVIGIVLAAFLTWMVFGMVGELIKAGIFARPLAFSLDGERLGQLAGLTGVTIARILQFSMIGLLAAVVSRSVLAALFVPMVVAIGQFFLMQGMPLLGWTPGDLQAHLLVPGLSHDMLKIVIQGGPAAAEAPDGVAWKAMLSLAVWTVIPLAAALAWFSRQDLSKE